MFKKKIFAGLFAFLVLVAVIYLIVWGGYQKTPLEKYYLDAMRKFNNFDMGIRDARI